MKRIILFCVLLMMCIVMNAIEKTLQVIPLPQECQLTDKMIAASSLTTVSAPEKLQNEVSVLQNGFGQYAGRTVQKVNKKGKIQLSVNSFLSEEEYVLMVKSGKVTIEGGSAKGVFYGIQTLLQELNAYNGKLVCGVIKDKPRYAWRGYMLDESRHFFGEKQVKQTLDMMAFYKLNKFHWHLTDAQGWRIEIKAYPKLTTIGAIGNHTNANAATQFYTQKQIRDIVAYAAARHIDVIPEVDMPGHASSATRSYPELGVEKGAFTYNPVKDSVYIFINAVVKEVAGLFPYNYFHIGGDEVSLGNKNWKTDAAIQNYMKEKGYRDLKQVEADFHKRITPIINGYGKDLITWDDVLELGTGHLGKAISWWRHDRMDHLYDALDDNYEVILCPRLPMYFDFVQDSTHTSGRKWYKDGAFNPIENVYAYPESMFQKWDKSESLKKGIMGFQANLWTETVETQARREYMTYPRLCALAEATWTAKGNKNFDSFKCRLEPAYSLFDKMGIYYCDYRDMNHHPEAKK